MKKIVEDLERDDLVEPTHSDWAAPSLLVPKKDGTYRLVVDYRGLNKQIVKTYWPLPRINEVIDSLEGNMYFSNIDLLLGYFQMALEEESQNVTAFITPLGLYKWKRLPMGLASAPGAFQNLMELVFAGLSYEIALVYLDDVIVFGRNFEEHLKRLELVFQRLLENGLKIKRSKCNFFPKARQLFRTYYISEWCRGRPRESKSGRKHERTIIPKRRQGFSGPCGLLSKIHPGFRKNIRASLQVTK